MLVATKYNTITTQTIVESLSSHEEEEEEEEGWKWSVISLASDNRRVDYGLGRRIPGLGILNLKRKEFRFQNTYARIFKKKKQDKKAVKM